MIPARSTVVQCPQLTENGSTMITALVLAHFAVGIVLATVSADQPAPSSAVLFALISWQATLVAFGLDCERHHGQMATMCRECRAHNSDLNRAHRRTDLAPVGIAYGNEMLPAAKRAQAIFVNRTVRTLSAHADATATTS